MYSKSIEIITCFHKPQTQQQEYHMNQRKTTVSKTLACNNKQYFGKFQHDKNRVPSIKKEYVKIIFDSLKNQMQYHQRNDMERILQQNLLQKQVYEQSFYCKSDIQQFALMSQRLRYTLHRHGQMNRQQNLELICIRKQNDFLKVQLKKAEEKLELLSHSQTAFRLQSEIIIETKNKIINELQTQLRRIEEINHQLSAKSNQCQVAIQQLKESLKRKNVRNQILQRQIQNLHLRAIKSKQRISKLRQRISINAEISTYPQVFSQIRNQISYTNNNNNQQLQGSDLSGSSEEHQINSAFNDLERANHSDNLAQHNQIFNIITKKSFRFIGKNKTIVQKLNSLKNLLGQCSNTKQEYQKMLQRQIQQQNAFIQNINYSLSNFLLGIQNLKQDNLHLKHYLMQNSQKFHEHFQIIQGELEKTIMNSNFNENCQKFPCKILQQNVNKIGSNFRLTKQQFKGLKSKYFSQEQNNYLGWKL